MPKLTSRRAGRDARQDGIALTPPGPILPKRVVDSIALGMGETEGEGGEARCATEFASLDPPSKSVLDDRTITNALGEQYAPERQTKEAAA